MPFSVLVVEVTHDDERIARREAVLSPEGVELLVEISRGVFLQNEEPARLKEAAFIRAGEDLLRNGGRGFVSATLPDGTIVETNWRCGL